MITLRVFLDGLKLQDGCVGWGYATFLGAIQTGLDKGSLGRKAEVFNAELIGATEGLRSI